MFDKTLKTRLSLYRVQLCKTDVLSVANLLIAYHYFLFKKRFMNIISKFKVFIRLLSKSNIA